MLCLILERPEGVARERRRHRRSDEREGGEPRQDVPVTTRAATRSIVMTPDAAGHADLKLASGYEQLEARTARCCLSGVAPARSPEQCQLNVSDAASTMGRR